MNYPNPMVRVALELEKALLSRMILNPGDTDVILAAVKGEWINDHRCQLIFAAATESRLKGYEVDEVSLSHDLSHVDPSVNWGALIPEITRSGSRQSTKELIARVFGAWKTRVMWAAGQALSQAALTTTPENAGSLLANHYEQLAAIEESVATRDGDTGLADAYKLVLLHVKERLEAADDDQSFGQKTGWRTFDRQLGGLVRGRMITITAPTGGGKSAFAGCLVRAAARYISRSAAGGGVSGRILVFNFEMETRDQATRHIADQAGVDGLKIQNAELTDDQIHKLIQAEKDARTAGYNEIVRIRACAGATIAEVRRWIRRYADDPVYPLAGVVIDYLQIVKAPPGYRSREQEVAALSGQVLEICSEFKVWALVLSQENDDGNTRDSKKVEHDSDAIISVHPLDKEPAANDQVPVMDIDLRKNRHGPVLRRGAWTMLFNKPLQRFAEVVRTVGGPEEAPPDYDRDTEVGF